MGTKEFIKGLMHDHLDNLATFTSEALRCALIDDRETMGKLVKGAEIVVSDLEKLNAIHEDEERDT